MGFRRFLAATSPEYRDILVARMAAREEEKWRAEQAAIRAHNQMVAQANRETRKANRAVRREARAIRQENKRTAKEWDEFSRRQILRREAEKVDGRY